MTMKVAIKILMIDVNRTWGDLLKHDLEEILKDYDFEVIVAFPGNARQLFLRNQDVRIVIIGDCVINGGGKVSDEILNLVRWVKNRFNGLFIADSSHDDYGQALMSAGCDSRTTSRSNLPQAVAYSAKRICSRAKL